MKKIKNLVYIILLSSMLVMVMITPLKDDDKEHIDIIDSGTETIYAENISIWKEV